MGQVVAEDLEKRRSSLMSHVALVNAAVWSDRNPVYLRGRGQDGAASRRVPRGPASKPRRRHSVTSLTL